MATVSVILTICLTSSLACTTAEEAQTVGSRETRTTDQLGLMQSPSMNVDKPTSPLSITPSSNTDQPKTAEAETISHHSPQVLQSPSPGQRSAPYSVIHMTEEEEEEKEGTQSPVINDLQTTLTTTGAADKQNNDDDAIETSSKPFEIPAVTFSDCQEDESDENTERKSSANQTPAFPFTCHNSTAEQIPLKKFDASSRSAMPVMPQPPPIKFESAESLCGPLTRMELGTMKGELNWSPDCNSCRQQYYWRYVPFPDHGYVVEFHTVDMREEDNITVNTLRPGNPTTETEGVYSAEKRIGLTLAPLFVRGGLEVIFSTSLDKCGNSILKINFTAHPLSSLPEVVSDNNRPDKIESRILYNCSGIADLPDAILCDGIQHCQSMEDEMNCSYREQGCGDWFPYNEFCLKATFALRPGLVSGGSFFTMPLQAEEMCRSQNGAHLATLPDIAGKQLATEMIRKSGFTSATIGIKKVQPMSPRLKHLYRFIWQWGMRGSPIAYELQSLQRIGIMEECGFLDIKPSPAIKPMRCVLPNDFPLGYICMRRNPTYPTQNLPSHISFPRPLAAPDQFPTKECLDGSLVQTFHRCQWKGREMDAEEGETETTGGRSLSGFPLFRCQFGTGVHYAVVCDGLFDCPDGSDEMDCPQPRFAPLRDSSFLCRSWQAVSEDKRCDGITDCFDESDEDSCLSCSKRIMCDGVGCVPHSYTQLIKSCPPQPPYTLSPTTDLHAGSLNMDGTGMSITDYWFQQECMEGYFQCLSGLCIPSFLVNNGEKDCPKGEDEAAPPHNVTCPGYYRCRTSGACVHRQYLCDGVYHCPDKDDEAFCGLACPTDRGCVCEGNAYRCSEMIDPLQNLHVRYLDVNHASNVSLDKIHVMEYLLFLNLSFCNLRNVTFGDMPHLQTLDLSSNYLTDVTHLRLYKLSGLLHLNLSNNPFARTLANAFSTFTKLAELTNLQTLIMVNVSLESIENRVYGGLSKLKHLDIRNNDVVSFYEESLWGLDSLQELYTEVPKLCCGFFHASISKCHAPQDELSSCSDLIASNIFRVFLWALAVLAIAGNGGVLIYRLFINRSTAHPAFSVLVKNLCGSDLLMGVYMAIIGVADARFQGRYVAKETEWRNSALCTVAGFFSFVSSETSAFVICLITLDRILVVSCPLNRERHLSYRVSIALCCLVWLIAIILAGFPLLLDMDFYGQNGICIPLPITRQKYSGQGYSFGIFIILNFILFVLIGVGQVLIFVAVRKARRASGSQRRNADLAIAQRLFLVVFTDFCCWFPVGLMGLMASGGIPIPGEWNVAVAIFVLPLNSALNPFLYTLNGLAEQWKKKRMERKTKMLLGKFQTEIPKWHPSNVQQLMKICIQSKSVEKDVVLKWLGVQGHTSSPYRPGTDNLPQVVDSGLVCKEFTNITYDESDITHDSHVYITDEKPTGNTEILHSNSTE